MGDAPMKSPSLKNYPDADKKVLAMASELWGNETCLFINMVREWYIVVLILWTLCCLRMDPSRYEDER